MELDDEIEIIKLQIANTEERELLLANLPFGAIKVFTAQNVFIAGGAITSIFSGTPIRDYDIFFRDETSFEKVNKVFKDDGQLFANTPNAVTYKNLYDSGCTVQLVKLPTSIKENPIDIFTEFDFTVCCGLFDFKTNCFAFHKDFLKHVSQRKLVYNSTHRFPISTLLRSQKYKEKGYTLDQVNLLKIVISIGALNIKTNADAAKQFQGMYLGDSRIAFEKLLTDETPFVLEKFLDVVKDMTHKPTFGKPVVHHSKVDPTALSAVKIADLPF